MDYKVYWVGEKPGGAMTITVLDQETGLPANLSSYSEAKIVMLDSDNREVDLGSGETVIASAEQGRVGFIWPAEKSLFTKAGDYVFQLVLTSPSGFVAKTDVQNIVVKRLGGRR